MPISKLEKKFILEQLSPISEELQQMLQEFIAVLKPYSKDEAHSRNTPVKENLLIFTTDDARDRYWNCIHKLNKVIEDVENS